MVLSRRWRVSKHFAGEAIRLLSTRVMRCVKGDIMDDLRRWIGRL